MYASIEPLTPIIAGNGLEILRALVRRVLDIESGLFASAPTSSTKGCTLRTPLPVYGALPLPGYIGGWYLLQYATYNTNGVEVVRDFGQKYDKITMMSAAIAMLSTSTNQKQNQACQIF